MALAAQGYQIRLAKVSSHGKKSRTTSGGIEGRRKAMQRQSYAKPGPATAVRRAVRRGIATATHGIESPRAAKQRQSLAKQGSGKALFGMAGLCHCPAKLGEAKAKHRIAQASQRHCTDRQSAKRQWHGNAKPRGGGKVINNRHSTRKDKTDDCQ